MFKGCLVVTSVHEKFQLMLFNYFKDRLYRQGITV